MKHEIYVTYQWSESAHATLRHTWKVTDRQFRVEKFVDKVNAHSVILLNLHSNGNHDEPAVVNVISIKFIGKSREEGKYLISPDNKTTTKDRFFRF